MLSQAAPPERTRAVALLESTIALPTQARLGHLRRLSGDDLIHGVACKTLSEEAACGDSTLGRATHHDVGDRAY
jgi:hypothetical protein